MASGSAPVALEPEGCEPRLELEARSESVGLSGRSNKWHQCRFCSYGAKTAWEVRRQGAVVDSS